MKKINLRGISEILSEKELKNVMGGSGVTQAEYCATMEMLWINNAGSWNAATIEGWWYGWKKNF